MTRHTTSRTSEFNKLIKLLEFRLPTQFKKIGYLGAVLTFSFLLGYKFLGDQLIVKDVLRTLVLLFLLIASLSKDVFEDEFNQHMRYQSYVFAFVFALVYSISIPLIAIIFDVVITRFVSGGTLNFHEVSSFEVMFILMGMQLLVFETLKKYGICETD